VWVGIAGEPDQGWRSIYGGHAMTSRGEVPADTPFAAADLESADSGWRH
jgi:hypothetical protein